MSKKNLDAQGRLRSKTVAFRVSPEEAMRLDALVAMSGLTKQDYIIARLLDQGVKVVPSSRVQKGMEEGMQVIYAELLRLGQGESVQPEVVDLLQMLATLFAGFGGSCASPKPTPQESLRNLERGD